MRRLVPLLLLASLFVLASERAEAAELHVDQKDQNLKIQGQLDGDVSFTGAVRLTFTGAEAATIQLLADELSPQEDGDPIARSNISIPSGSTLPANQPADVIVTVNNVQRPGTYEGTLTFFVEDSPDVSATINLSLVVRDKIEIAGLQETTVFDLTRCSRLCSFSALFVNQTELDTIRFLPLKSETQEPVRITDVTVTMRGEQTGTFLDDSQVEVGIGTIPASRVGRLAVTLEASDIPADRYVGFVRLTAEGEPDPLDIPLEIAVRDGLLLPLFLIFIGIVLGRVARGQQTPRATLQMALLPRLYDLRDAAKAGILNKGAFEHVEEIRLSLATRIEKGTETREVLDAAMGVLEAKIEFLSSLERLESRLPSSSLPREKQRELATLIRDARTLTLAGKPEEAESKRTAVKSALDVAGADAAFQPEASELKAAFRRPGPSLAASEENEEQVKEQHGGPTGFHKFTAGLTGLKPGTLTRFWVVRPALWVLVLILLMLLGLQFLYLDSDTFGAGGLADYVGLILWGLTADVTAATVLSLPTKA